MKRIKNKKSQDNSHINLMFTAMYKIKSKRNFILISKAVEEFKGKIKKISLLVTLYLLDPKQKVMLDSTFEFYQFKKGYNSKIVGDLVKMLGDDLISYKDDQGNLNADLLTPRRMLSVFEIIKNFKFKDACSVVTEIPC